MEETFDHKLNVVACMYGGWQILDKNLNIVYNNAEYGSNLLYGATADASSPGNLIVSTCTFNDCMVRMHLLQTIV